MLPSLAAASLGVLFGVGSATLDYAEGLSYLRTDPEACVNCHIMRPQYDAWQKASHHAVATCAGCHIPVGFPQNYVAKVRNGWNHSKAFTLQDFPEPIVITERNADILHENCLRCHADLVHDQGMAYTEGAPRCMHCHVSVGHGEQAGLGGPLPPRRTKRSSQP